MGNRNPAVCTTVVWTAVEALREISNYKGRQAVKDLNVKIFLDGADLSELRPWVDHPLVAGFTSNPGLIRKAGVTDYMDFARQYVEMAKHKPVSLEVLSMSPKAMIREARLLASLGNNVAVKVPCRGPNGEDHWSVIKKLIKAGCRVNITCAFTTQDGWTGVLTGAAYVSVFAGRISDTGRDPVAAVTLISNFRTMPLLPFPTEIIWASSRQAYDVYLANMAGADIITLHPRLFERFLTARGKDLEVCSQETVAEFCETAKGYAI